MGDEAGVLPTGYLVASLWAADRTTTLTTAPDVSRGSAVGARDASSRYDRALHGLRGVVAEPTRYRQQRDAGHRRPDLAVAISARRPAVGDDLIKNVRISFGEARA